MTTFVLFPSTGVLDMILFLQIFPASLGNLIQCYRTSMNLVSFTEIVKNFYTMCFLYSINFFSNVRIVHRIFTFIVIYFTYFKNKISSLPRIILLESIAAEVFMLHN